MIKEWLSAVAIALTLAAFLPYIRAILRGAVRPHVFSWVIWSITTFVVFLAQLADRGGAGAWPTGVSACITIIIALLGWRKRADISISAADRIFNLIAVLAVTPLFCSTKVNLVRSPFVLYIMKPVRTFHLCTTS